MGEHSCLRCRGTRLATGAFWRCGACGLASSERAEPAA